jgi:aspartyl/asparaginyl-tRNA synthetase
MHLNMLHRGGFSFGAERITMQFWIKKFREASMFPRDMERIDERLNKEQTDEHKAKKD